MDIVEVCETHVRERFLTDVPHYPGCEQGHVICALKELLELTQHLLSQVMDSEETLDRERAQHAADVERLALELRSRDGDEGTSA